MVCKRCGRELTAEEIAQLTEWVACFECLPFYEAEFAEALARIPADEPNMEGF